MREALGFMRGENVTVSRSVLMSDEGMEGRKRKALLEARTTPLSSQAIQNLSPTVSQGTWQR